MESAYLVRGDGRLLLARHLLPTNQASPHDATDRDKDKDRDRHGDKDSSSSSRAPPTTPSSTSSTSSTSTSSTSSREGGDWGWLWEWRQALLPVLRPVMCGTSASASASDSSDGGSSGTSASSPSGAPSSAYASSGTGGQAGPSTFSSSSSPSSSSSSSSLSSSGLPSPSLALPFPGQGEGEEGAGQGVGDAGSRTQHVAVVGGRFVLFAPVGQDVFALVAGQETATDELALSRVLSAVCEIVRATCSKKGKPVTAEQILASYARINLALSTLLLQRGVVDRVDVDEVFALNELKPDEERAKRLLREQKELKKGAKASPPSFAVIHLPGGCEAPHT